MNRLKRIILQNLWCIPGLKAKLKRCAQSPDKYTHDERMKPIQTICERIQKSGDISLKVSGKENIPAEGGFIFYPNHQGIFDAVALASAIDIPFSPVLKKELMSYPLLRQIFTCVDAMPMDRSDIRQSMRVLQEVQSRVESGRVCLIFPEGTRSRDGNQLQEFKAGCFRPALKTHCPVVPVALVDSFKPFDAETVGHITVFLHILKPLLWEDYQGLTTAELAQMVKEKIQGEMERILSETKEVKHL